jgi:hypothetical protein
MGQLRCLPLGTSTPANAPGSRTTLAGRLNGIQPCYADARLQAMDELLPQWSCPLGTQKHNRNSQAAHYELPLLRHFRPLQRPSKGGTARMRRKRLGGQNLDTEPPSALRENTTDELPTLGNCLRRATVHVLQKESRDNRLFCSGDCSNCWRWLGRLCISRPPRYTRKACSLHRGGQRERGGVRQHHRKRGHQLARPVIDPWVVCNWKVSYASN